MRLILLLTALSVYIVACNNSATKDKKTEEPGKELKISGGDDEMVEDILNRFKKYTINEDMEGMISLISPSLLEKTTKEDLLKELQEGMHNENYDLAIKDIKYHDISRIIKKDGNKYALAKTRTTGSFKMKSGSFEDFCETFKHRYQGVICDKNDQTVSFEINAEVYILYTDEDKKWFILSDSDPEGIEELIPADVMKELGIIIHDEE